MAFFIFSQEKKVNFLYPLQPQQILWIMKLLDATHLMMYVKTMYFLNLFHWLNAQMRHTVFRGLNAGHVTRITFLKQPQA